MKIFRRNKKKESNSDFETFKTEIIWFISPNSKVSIQELNVVKLSEEFKNTFPNLTELIEKSRQTHLKIDDINYILFAWDNKSGEVCGWLNEQEKLENHKFELIEDHKVLIKNIGGIRESFNQPEGAFTNNQNFLFNSAECFRGIKGYEEYYSTICSEENKNQIDYSNFVTFVCEANGSLTLYDLKTERVFLFSHDHCFENVEFVKNQPEYTFHTFKVADTFRNYVEELAKQWKMIIK